MRKLLIFALIIIVFTECQREKFDTLLNIRLVSGINSLKVLPCPVLVYRQIMKDGVPNSKQFIDTIFTDSFGNVSKFLSLAKISKNQYYTAELVETKWQLPYSGEHNIIAGIENNIGFGIKPKWRYSVTLEDSSGKYALDAYSCYNSLTKSYFQNESFDSFPKFGQNFFYTSSPTYSHIIIILYLHSRTTHVYKEIKKAYDSEKSYNIWLKF